MLFGDLLPQAGLAAKIPSVAVSCLNGQVSEAGLEDLAALQACWVGGVSMFPVLGGACLLLAECDGLAGSQLLCSDQLCPETMGTGLK